MPEQKLQAVSRVTLTSLPKEILLHIATLLPKTSILSLIRVARRFTSLADDRRVWRLIWHNVSLEISEYYGESPLIQPEFCVARDEDKHFRLWALDETRCVSQRHKSALRARVEAVVHQAGTQKWSAVRQMSMRPRTGALRGMMSALNSASPYLEILVIHAGSYQPLKFEGFPITFETLNLGVDLIQSGISFPNLTHLQLSSLSTHQSDALCRLLTSAPTLSSLDITLVDDHGFDGRSIDEVASEYTSLRLTNIRRLRFSWEEKSLGHQEHHAEAAVCHAVLKQCPELREVNIHYSGRVENDIECEIAETLSELEHLRDLRWPSSAYMLEETEGGFRNLRRLVLEDGTLSYIIPDLTGLHSLEAIYIIDSVTTSPKPGMSPDYPDPFPSLTSRVFDILAAHFRALPILHIIHVLGPSTKANAFDLFDRLNDIESSGLISSTIRSVFIESIEIIEMKFSREFEKIARRLPVDQARFYPQPEFALISFEVRGPNSESEERINVFRRLQEPVVCVLTDFRRLAVPQEIMQEMRGLEGGDFQYWDRRGVELSSARALDFMRDWYRGRMAANQVGPTTSGRLEAV